MVRETARSTVSEGALLVNFILVIVDCRCVRAANAVSHPTEG